MAGREQVSAKRYWGREVAAFSGGIDSALGEPSDGFYFGESNDCIACHFLPRVLFNEVVLDQLSNRGWPISVNR